MLFVGGASVTYDGGRMSEYVLGHHLKGEARASL
jgi:hypothetical protein